MKKLFVAIRHGDIATVKLLLNEKPELVNCIAKQPPKKDDGQSPLQVALKSGNYEIAELLLQYGANVNFIEDEATCCNQWRAPVIHDAINCAVMSSRWNSINSYKKDLSGNGTIEIHSTKEKADYAYQILKEMIAQGADVNALDSFGNNGLWRYCLQASQILPRYNYKEDCESNNRIFTKELESDLLRILILLKNAGVDYKLSSNSVSQSPIQFYKKGSLHTLLEKVFIEENHI